jgi:hypothetical protein
MGPGHRRQVDELRDIATHVPVPLAETQCLHEDSPDADEGDLLIDGGASACPA